jgi:ubiquinone/menaquinone biosynthesis C-methylase UbiE
MNNIFINPKTKEKLSKNSICSQDGIYDFLYYDELHEITRDQKSYYDNNASIYDDVAHLSFQIQNEDETKVRENFINWLSIEKDHCVLDLSCGTGKDSEGIAKKLKTGSLYCADISREMLKICKKKIDVYGVDTHYCVVNAEYLPFEDNSFDRLISFGGLNVFGNLQKALKEMSRVVKPGGKILVGDESMPPWLYDTEFGKILLDNNPLFRFELPIKYIPIEARNVVIRWIIGGVYYMIEFDVGIGEPVGNFDLPIPGKRGGTLNTRYYGKLEGVKPELKDKILKQAVYENKSVYEWLSSNLERFLEH